MTPTPDSIKTIASDIHHTALALELPESVYNDYTKWLTQAINNELTRARADEHKILLDRYAKVYKRISKEHGVSQPVPHTAFHQISEERIAQLKQSQTEQDTPNTSNEVSE